MAPKGSKRAAAPTIPRAKKAKLTPQEEQLQAVARSLEAAAGLPESCCAMLLAVLPTSLGAPADARHAVQDHVVVMVGESLAKVRSDKEGAASRAAEEAAAAEGRQAALQAAQTTAEGALEVKTKAAQDQKAALGSADAALAEAKATLAGKQQAEQAAKDAEVAKKAECDAFDATVSEHLGPLREGTWDDGAPTGQQRVDSLKPILLKAELDGSVMASLGISGSKKASERTSFDNMVLEQVATSLSEKAAALRRELAEKGPGLAEAGAAVAAQASEVEKAEATSQERKAAFEKAQAERQASEALWKAAAQELKAFTADAKKVMKARDAAQADLDLFTSGPLAAFETLKNATSKSTEAATEAAAAGEEAPVSVTVGGA